MAQGAPAKLTLPTLIVLIVVLAALVPRAIAGAPPHRGAQAPAFSLPVVANGKGTVSLDSLKGHAVYLNFFASWCEPCKAEVPYIVTLSKEYGKHNIVVVGIDELESADKAKQFASQFHMPYTIALDDSGDVGGSYGLYGMPLSVFIAPNGTVAAYHVGQMSEAKIRAELQALTTQRH
ncbi:MAG TPA: TlpA disulfide reductase family protein [Candidatus Eremiobacteraceae bacterium]|nr:TlpA disulfide reductase family protein [Candidatus Eremiobacteraceae bacterium]